MADYPWRDKERLRELYVDEEMSTVEIAERWSTGSSTIGKWLDRHGIDARDPSEGSSIRMRKDAKADRELTRELYNSGSRPTEIAERVGRPVMTVRTWIYEMGIQRDDFECPTCGSGFDTENGMKVHHARSHGESIAGIEVGCAYCGEVTRVQRKRAEEFNQIFCSARCMGMWQSENVVGEESRNWKGGYEPYYGPNWESQRRRAIDRDGEACQMCETPRGDLGLKLHVHHIRPFRNFKQSGRIDYEAANSLDNLICLCARCHMIAEQFSPLLPES